MKYARPTLPQFLRTLTVGVLISTGIAHADDYGEIQQLLRAGKTAEALTKVDQRLSATPRDPQLRFLRGVVLTETGKVAEAISAFTKLTEDYPELPEPYNNLAVLYANQNQLEKARAALEMAIRTNPSYATAHENIGDIYAKLASQAYNKALQLDAGTAASLKPKLALIRELFSMDVAKGAKPLSVAQASSTPMAAAQPAAPRPTTVRPTAPAPTPAPSAATAAAPTAPAVNAAPAPVTAQIAPAPSASAQVAAVAQATPSVKAPAAPEKKDTTRESADIAEAVETWAAAWSAKDMKGYLSAYSKDFALPSNLNRSAWEKERALRILGKSKISVQVSDLKIDINGSKATARFRQAYKADALSMNSRKTLELARVGERWLIVKESTGS